MKEKLNQWKIDNIHLKKRDLHGNKKSACDLPTGRSTNSRNNSKHSPTKSGKTKWSKQDFEEFEKLCAPLVKFIQQRHDKCNPYSWIIIQ